MFKGFALLWKCFTVTSCFAIFCYYAAFNIKIHSKNDAHTKKVVVHAREKNSCPANMLMGLSGRGGESVER